MGKLSYFLLAGGIKSEFLAAKENWAGNLKIGSRHTIKRPSVLDRYLGGTLTIGLNVRINKYCKISTCGGNLTIGNNVNFGENVTITAQGGDN